MFLLKRQILIKYQSINKIAIIQLKVFEKMKRNVTKKSFISDWNMSDIGLKLS